MILTGAAFAQQPPVRTPACQKAMTLLETGVPQVARMLKRGKTAPTVEERVLLLETARDFSRDLEDMVRVCKIEGEDASYDAFTRAGDNYSRDIQIFTERVDALRKAQGAK